MPTPPTVDPTALRVEREGVTLSGVVAGPADGEPVVLLHGFPQDSSCWDGVLPFLHEGGLRTVVVDQRGYGDSSRPPGVAPYRVEELVADVLAVLDDLGLESAHVVGHDWGGAVAWHLAAHHPDRVRSVTVLSTPHPSALAWSMTRSRQPLLSWYALFFQLPVVPEVVLSSVLDRVLRGGGLPPVVAARYAQAMRRPVALGPPLAWYRAALRRPPWAHPLSVPSVTVPTTYVWGRHDPTLGRAAAQRTREHVEGPYRFVEVDEGHWLPELRPAVVADAVLDRVGAWR